MKRLTSYIYNVLGIICFVVWAVNMVFQVKNPHPIRGLIGNLVLLIGCLLFYIHAKINHIKSPMYDPDKRKHIRNWVVVIVIDVIVAFGVGFLYWKRIY